MIGRYRFRQPEHQPAPEVDNLPQAGLGELDRIPANRMGFPLDVRRVGERPYDVTDDEGLDRSDDPIMERPRPAPTEPNWFEGHIPDASQTPSSRKYSGPDQDGDGIADEVASWLQDQRASPEEKKRRWVQENVWDRGLTVDEATGEIIDPNTGQTVGHLPRFGMI